ncbi:MAG TPA: hypothetical protein VF074_02510, partial [Pyrinomonadaceae bacterium]
MVNAIPSFLAGEPIEFGHHDEGRAWPDDQTKLVVASYNIRYARGPFLISGGVLRKIGMLSGRRRSDTVSNNIRRAAAVFASGKLMPPIDLLAVQEADKETVRA